MPVINARGPIERAREIRRQIRLRRHFERRMVKDLRKELKRVGEEAIGAFEHSGGNAEAALAATADHERRIRSIYERNLLATGLTFGNRLLDEAKALGLMLETKRDYRFEDELSSYINRQVAERVVAVSDHTKQSIRNAIHRTMQADARLEGIVEPVTSPIPKVAKAIRAYTDGAIARTRSFVIARTETHAASVTGQDLAAGRADVEFVREWVAAHDDRTRGGTGDRTSHRITDGRQTGQREPFAVARLDGRPDDLLMRPGDPDGPADQVINCRCAVTYLPPETIRQEKDAVEKVQQQIIDDPDFQFEQFKSMKDADLQLRTHFGIKAMEYTSPPQSARYWGGRYTAAQWRQQSTAVANEVLAVKRRIPEVNFNGVWYNNRKLKSSSGLANRGTRTFGVTERYLGAGYVKEETAKYYARAAFDRSATPHEFTMTRTAQSLGDDSLKHTIRHEIGHTMETPSALRRVYQWIADSMGWVFRETQINDNMMNARGVNQQDWALQFLFHQDGNPVTAAEWKKEALPYIRSSVSRYAGTNAHETLAEAFAWRTAPGYKEFDMPKGLEEATNMMLQGRSD